MKCSIPCEHLSAIVPTLAAVTYCMIRPPPSSSLQDTWSHSPGRSCCWSLRCFPIHTWLGWQGFSRSTPLTHLLLRRLSTSCWEVHRGKVTCQRMCYQTLVVIPYKQPAPKPKDHRLCHEKRTTLSEQISVLTFTWKGLLLKSTCG